jgi:Zn-dependent protease
MLFTLFNQFSDNPPALFAYFAAFGVALVTGIGFHEFSHAWAANELGDDTAARRGRLTLNPLAHVDPMGMVVMLLIGFGWGKPTPVNPYRLRNGPKQGNMLVALAGPASNFVFAVIAALPLRLGLIDSIANLDNIRDASGQEIVGLFLIFIVFYNVLLGVFNLIPIPPLDGFKVAVGILPGEASRQLASLEPYGMGILMTMLVISFVSGGAINPIGWLIGGIQSEIFRFII